jgi:hypothetical protein
MKVELVLPCKWTHPENVTRQVSHGERNICGSSLGVHTWAVVVAWQLHDVGVELFHMLHKLTHADLLGLLEYVCQGVPLLLSCVVGKHGEKVGTSHSHQMT